MKNFFYLVISGIMVLTFIYTGDNYSSTFEQKNLLSTSTINTFMAFAEESNEAVDASISCPSPVIIWEQIGGNVTAFSSDGTMLAACGNVRTVRLLNPDDGSIIRELIERRLSQQSAVAFSPDNSLLAVGTERSNLNLNVFRLSDGARIFISSHSDGVTGVAFSPDSSILASGGRDRRIRLWNTNDFILIRTILNNIRILSLAYSPEGTYVVSGDGRGLIKFWDVTIGTVIRTLTGHSGGVNQVVFSPSGTILASSAFDNTIRLWNVSDGSLLRIISIPTGTATSLDFSQDNNILIAGTSELIGSTSVGFVRFWDVNDGTLIKSYNLSPALQVKGVRFSPDNNAFIYGIDDTTTMAENPF